MQQRQYGCTWVIERRDNQWFAGRSFKCTMYVVRCTTANVGKDEERYGVQVSVASTSLSTILIILRLRSVLLHPEIKWNSNY